MRGFPILPGTVIALCLGLLALLIYGQQTSGTPNTIDSALADGKPTPAPGFKLAVLEPGRGDATLRRALADGRLSPSELRGRPSVINFWASWCPPCRQETPLLQKAWQANAKRVRFIGINMQDVRSDARRFVRGLGVTYPQVRDPDNDVAGRWEVRGLPETFFLDRRGRVVSHVVGAISAQALRKGLAAAKSGRPQQRLRGGQRQDTR